MVKSKPSKGGKNKEKKGLATLYTLLKWVEKVVFLPLLAEEVPVQPYLCALSTVLVYNSKEYILAWQDSFGVLGHVMTQAHDKVLTMHSNRHDPPTHLAEDTTVVRLKILRLNKVVVHGE